jgi:hypothetical protein
MTTRLYDPKRQTLLVGGVPISGWADGEFFTVVYDEDSFVKVVGTDGHTSRSKNENKNARLVIKLMQTSKSNDFLSALLNADLLTDGGSGIVPVVVKDNNGTDLFTSAKAWIVKPPDRSGDKTAKNRDWNFDCTDCVDFQGGTD